MGMETTGMALLALSFVAAAWASRGSYGRWALTGVVAGGAAASMGFMPVLMLGILPLLFERFDRLSRREQLGRLAAAAAPLLIWIVAIGWYNAYRTGSVTNFDDVYSLNVLSAPFSAAGLFAGPRQGAAALQPAGDPRLDRLSLDVAPRPDPRDRGAGRGAPEHARDRDQERLGG